LPCWLFIYGLRDERRTAGIFNRTYVYASPLE
jgi:hypothetical protein